MTSTVVGLCNLALTRLGHNQISSLSENSKGATLCTLHYPQVRDALLRAHPWNFAIARRRLKVVLHQARVPAGRRRAVLEARLGGECIAHGRDGGRVEHIGNL